MTNGDVIRKRLSEMTDKELCSIGDEFMCYLFPKSECEKYTDKGCFLCKMSWEDWLQQTVELQGESNDVDTDWISVNESLPLLGVNVLVTRRMDNGVRYVRIASYQGDCWMDNTDEYMKPNPHPVIAWKSMPMAYCGKE